MNTANSDQKIEEILLQTKRKHHREEITPGNALKDKLDKALATKRREKSFFAFRIPLYQSVAAAAIFFVLGFGANLLRTDAPTEMVHSNKEVVRYVDKPVVTEIVKYIDRSVVKIRYIKEPVLQQTATYDAGSTQNLALNNSDDNLGVSLFEDTILQKMLVMIY